MADTSTLTDLATILGNAAGGRANGRKTAADLAQDSDRINVSRYLAQLQGGNLDLNQRKFALDAPSQRARNSAQGDVLANVQDASLSGVPSHIQVPTITGGLRPSLLSDNSRQLGQSMSRDALLQQMKGDQFDAAPKLAPVNPLPEPSLLDSLLSGGGTAAALLGALGKGDGNKSTVDIGKIISAIRNRNQRGNYPLVPGNGFGGDHTSTVGSRDPFGDNLPNYDEFGYYNDPNVFSGLPGDPSGGSGVGPGMDEYYRSLLRDDPGGGGGDQGLSGGDAYGYYGYE